LGVAPTQIVPNAWRYLFDSFILWRTVIGAFWNFFNIYRPAGKGDKTVEFSVHMKPIFIFLTQTYSNKKQWRQQTFRVSGQWEAADSEILFEDQRVPWEWAPLVNDLREPLELDSTERRRVDTVLHFSRGRGGD
jgi:hypothetical protein